MRPLNAAAIATAYFRFVGHFLLLIGSIVLVIYAFLTSLTQQVQQLGEKRNEYGEVLTAQREVAQKVDSIYSNLSLLNTHQVRSDRQVEQRILRQKDELNALLKQRIFARRPQEVYRRVSGCVNEMLVLKDSIADTEGLVKQIHREFDDCRLNGKKKK